MQPAFAEDPPPELCNGIDDDEDGDVDEGFDVGDDCSIPSTNQYGTCLTGGKKQCTDDGSGTECVLEAGVTLTQAEPEVLGANDLSCFDGVDNDCDGKADVGATEIEGVLVAADESCAVASEQFCNGFDDDNDGTVDNDSFNVGEPCTVGIGQCERTGQIICDPSDLTQTNTICSVSPGNPIAEDTPGKFRCVDGLDNDCDGAVDLADSSCQTDEKCDGADNDGDGSIDEDFVDLGDECSVGVGACAVEGSKVCNALGDGTQCNVVAALPGTEGPTGATCSDGIDNDCDGLTDDADPDCGSADISVSCSLVPLKRKPKGTPGFSCNDRYKVKIQSNVAPQLLTAEVLGLNPDGTLIDIAPNAVPVKNGYELHLTSRLDPDDWKIDAKGRFVDAFAPVPLVRVTADTGQTVVDAYCSSIPWMNVVEPSGQGQVVSASEGDVVDVLVPIPRVDPKTLAMVVDGVEIFPLLGINPANDFPNPGNPISGTVDINGHMVTVSDLVVDSSPLDVLGRNTLTAKLSNLGGGGHIVVFNGDPEPGNLPPQTSAECHVDDILAAGIVSVFGITIKEPTENAVLPQGQTHVEATVAHGREISSVHVQGLDYTPVDSQTCGALEFEAFGQTFSVDSCTLEVVTDLDQTDFTEGLKMGTVDLGRNVLNVSAQDDLLNMTFADRRFTLGEGITIPPGVQSLSPQQQALLEKSLEQKLENAFLNSPSGLKPLDIEVTASGLDINLAFVFGVSEDGVNGFFQSSCSKAKADVEQKVDEALSNAKFDPVKVTDTGASCEPTVQIKGLDVNFVNDLVCNVDTQQDLLTVTVTLPDILFSVGVEGSCKDTFLGVCISETIIDVNLAVNLLHFGVMFDLDEQLVLQGGSSPADFIMGEINIPPPNVGIEFNCITGFFNDVANFFTFGLFDFEEIASNSIENLFGEGVNVDLQEQLRNNSPDPLEVQKIQINEQIVQQDNLQVQQELLNIEITDDGFTGTIGASFTVPLPGEEGFDAVVTPSPSPQFPIPNVEDLFFAASDDIYNLLFAAIGLQGAFTTQCVTVPGPMGVGNLTLGDTLPADCDALTGADAFQTSVLRGRCHGAKGDDCAALTDFFESLTCSDTQNQLASRNISKDTTLLFCGSQPVGPRTLIKDNPMTVPVEATIHPNDFRITVAMDRNNDGMFDADQFFPLAQGCLGLFEDVTKDCKWVDACFDLNLAAEFNLGMNGGNAQIIRSVTGVSESVGFQCAGGLNLGPALLTEAGSSDPVSLIQTNIQNIVGIFEPLGLDLGSLVGLTNQRLIAIDVPGGDGDCADCYEYVGVTGKIVIPE